MPYIPSYLSSILFTIYKLVSVVPIWKHFIMH